MKTNKIAAAVLIGTAGVLALGACSSGADQAQPERDAAPSSAAPSALTSPTASPSPVNVPKLKSGPYKDVWMTYDSSAAQCIKPREEDGKFIVDCKNVGVTVIGDPVFVGVPNDKYRIEVTRSPDWRDPLLTIQRDWSYEKKHQSKDAHTVWVSPYSQPVYQHNYQWGVGMSGVWTFDNSTGPTAFTAVVTKIK